jgi:hypothetical protein
VVLINHCATLFLINRKDNTMTYLIIRETRYEGIENSFDIVDQTQDKDTAEDKLKGYMLINTNPRDGYSIVEHEQSLILTKEMRG